MRVVTGCPLLGPSAPRALSSTLCGMASCSSESVESPTQEPFEFWQVDFPSSGAMAWRPPVVSIGDTSMHLRHRISEDQATYQHAKRCHDWRYTLAISVRWRRGLGWGGPLGWRG